MTRISSQCRQRHAPATKEVARTPVRITGLAYLETVSSSVKGASKHAEDDTKHMSAAIHCCTFLSCSAKEDVHGVVVLLQ